METEHYSSLFDLVTIKGEKKRRIEILIQLVRNIEGAIKLIKNYNENNLIKCILGTSRFPKDILEISYIEALWKWSQIYGKRTKIGIHYYSKKGFQCYELKELENKQKKKKLGNVEMQRYAELINKIGEVQEIQEDHAVMRVHLIKDFEQLIKYRDIESITFKEVWDYLHNYCIGVNMLKSEHLKVDKNKEMPQGFDTSINSNVWEKYIDYNRNNPNNIEIIKVKWEGKGKNRKTEIIEVNINEDKPEIVPDFNRLNELLNEKGLLYILEK